MSLPEPSVPARSGVFCALHPERTAATLCHRCGSHACASCFQVAPDRHDYCLSCLHRLRPALAERGTRLAAVLLDLAFLFVPVFLSAVAASVITALNEYPALFSGVFTFIGLSLLSLLCAAVFQLALVVITGQSLGKRLMGIKVVRTDGGPVNLARLLLLRNVLPAVFNLPTAGLFAFIDVLIIFSEPRRCMHDYIADTQVIVLPESE